MGGQDYDFWPLSFLCSVPDSQPPFDHRKVELICLKASEQLGVSRNMRLDPHPGMRAWPAEALGWRIPHVQDLLLAQVNLGFERPARLVRAT